VDGPKTNLMQFINWLEMLPLELKAILCPDELQGLSWGAVHSEQQQAGWCELTSFLVLACLANLC